MKIQVLVGSNRKHGNTIRIVGLLDARMQALAVQHGMQLEFETLAFETLTQAFCRNRLYPYMLLTNH